MNLWHYFHNLKCSYTMIYIYKGKITSFWKINSPFILYGFIVFYPIFGIEKQPNNNNKTSPKHNLLIFLPLITFTMISVISFPKHSFTKMKRSHLLCFFSCRKCLLSSLLLLFIFYLILLCLYWIWVTRNVPCIEKLMTLRMDKMADWHFVFHLPIAWLLLSWLMLSESSTWQFPKLPSWNEPILSALLSMYN